MDHAQETATLLTLNLRALVDDPEFVTVVPKASSGGATTFQVHVSPKDMGKVIGSSGRMARALRLILTAIAKKHGVSYSLNVVGPDDEPYTQSKP